MSRRRQFPKVTRELLATPVINGHRCWACVMDPEAKEFAIDVRTSASIDDDIEEAFDVALSLSLDGCDPEDLP